MNFMELLRYAYPLDDKSVVVDVGGYEGRWAENIARLYDPYIFIYEPVPRFADICRRRFRFNPKVTVHQVAVSDREDERTFHIRSNDSGFSGKGVPTQVRCVDTAEVMRDKVDLLKLNVEGEEYRILGRLVGSGAIQNVKEIQVQFHGEIPYQVIHDELMKTHYLTWRYPFVWENWRRR